MTGLKDGPTRHGPSQARKTRIQRGPAVNQVRAHYSPLYEDPTIMVGGRVRARTQGVVDMWAVQILQSMQLDLAFIGANGVTEQGHLTTPDPAVAQVKEAAMASSARNIFIGDHTKFGRRTFTKFGALSSCESGITGKELGESRANRYRARGANLLLV